MANVRVSIELSLTKPEIVGSDLDDIEAWIKTNVTDKLPENATETHVVTIRE